MKHKFRAWDVFNNCYWHQHDGETLTDFFCRMKLFETGGNVLIYELSSGLKDKNQIEIYQGDFIQRLSWGHIYEDAIGQVVFKDGAFTETYWGNTLLAHSEVCFIIGNIHQSPELFRKR